MEPTPEQLEKIGAEGLALSNHLFNEMKNYIPTPAPSMCTAVLASLFKSSCEAVGIDRKDFASICQDLVNGYNEDEVEI